MSERHEVQFNTAFQTGGVPARFELRQQEALDWLDRLLSLRAENKVVEALRAYNRFTAALQRVLSTRQSLLKRGVAGERVKLHPRLDEEAKRLCQAS